MQNLKAIIKISIFCIIFVLIFVIVSYLSKPLDADKLNTSGFPFESDNSLDVIYIGGSAGYVYYEPLSAYEKYGIISYDYGVNSILLDSIKLMIKETIKKQNPKLIIIDARVLTYFEEYVENSNKAEISRRNLLTTTKISKNKIEYIEDNITENKLSYYLDILKYHENFSLNPENIKIMFNKYDNVNKGFYFVPKHEKQIEEDSSTNQTIELTQKTNEVLTDLLEFMKTTKYNYLFVVSPYVRKVEHKMMYNTASEKIKEYGYDFVDFNDYNNEMNINFNTDFYDKNHVNIFGADKYTDYLSKYIINNYNIPDRRNEKNYEYWNSYLPEWNRKVEETKNTIKNLESYRNAEL